MDDLQKHVHVFKYPNDTVNLKKIYNNMRFNGKVHVFTILDQNSCLNTVEPTLWSWLFSVHFYNQTWLYFSVKGTVA
jgi:hypothetical protein